MSAPTTSCPSCSAKLRLRDHRTADKIRCPRCDTVIPLSTAPLPTTVTIPVMPAIRETAPSAPPGKPVRHTRPAFTLDDDNKPTAVEPSVSAIPTQALLLNSFALPDHIALGIVGGGLFLLVLSPLCHWVRFLTGGVSGLATPGGIGILFFIAALLTATIYVAGFVRTVWREPAVLVTQFAGTVAVFFAVGYLIRLGRYADPFRHDGFASLIATQVGPGVGLYLALFGGILVAGSLGFVAVRMARERKLYFILQGGSCLCGIVLAVVMNLGKPSPGTLSGGAPGGGLSLSPSLSKRDPKTVRRLQDWYVATWPEVLQSEARKFESTFDDKHPYELRLMLQIHTEPDVPIRNVHGRLIITKDDKTLYTTDIEKVADVSFTDWTFTLVRIEYDDTNADHRTLRFTELKELVPTFTVRKVVYADGTVKTFE